MRLKAIKDEVALAPRQDAVYKRGRPRGARRREGKADEGGALDARAG